MQFSQPHRRLLAGRNPSTASSERLVRSFVAGWFGMDEMDLVLQDVTVQTFPLGRADPLETLLTRIKTSLGAWHQSRDLT